MTSMNIQQPPSHLSKVYLIVLSVPPRLTNQPATRTKSEHSRSNGVLDLKDARWMSYPMRKFGIDDLPATLHLYHLRLDFWKANL
jgi:hypothetical protein